MKALNRFVIAAAACCSLLMAGCSNVIEDLKQKETPVEKENPYITFESSDSFVLGINTTYGSTKGWDGHVYYATSTPDSEDSWTEWKTDSETITAAKSSGKYYIYLKGRENTTFCTDLDNDLFTMLELTGDAEKVYCSGNIMTLLECDKPDSAEMGDYCFAFLFYENKKLASAPALPAVKLSPYCYRIMFAGAEKLETPPELPAEELADHCYSYMFSNCFSMKNMPELKATKLAEACYESMFNGCSSITEAYDLPAETLETDCYSGMFSSCKKLKASPAVNAKTFADSCCRYMFLNCTSITSAGKISGGSKLDITESYALAEMFQGCSSLAVVECESDDEDCFLSIGTIDSTKYILRDTFTECADGSAAAQAGKSYKVAVPSYNVNWAGSISAAGDKSLWELSQNCSKIVIGKTSGYSSVASDSGYTSFAAGEGTFDKVTAYYKAPSGDSTYDGELYVLADEEIVFEDDDRPTYSYSGSDIPVGPFAVLQHADTVTLANIDTSAMTDMSFMFAMSSFTSLDLSQLDTGNAETMKGMFNSCNKLASLNMTGMDTSKAQDMMGMFNGCTVLCTGTTLDLSMFDTSNVTDMSWMFAECEGVLSINLSSFNTSKVTDMTYMFKNCKSVKAFDLSSFNTGSVTSMKDMFRMCVEAETINVSGFNTSSVSDMYDMFMECYKVKSLDLSSFTFGTETDLGQMFVDCYKLSVIYTAAGVDFALNTKTSEYTSIFADCSELAGGAGTEYSLDHITKAYGHVDSTGNPGYFTVKAAN